MAEFDIVSKQLFRDYPEDFLRFTLGREDVQILEVIDTEVHTVESRDTDIFVRVSIDGSEALVHIEFQTSDSTRVPMPRRMAGYIGRTIETHGLPIYSFVIYLRPDAGRGALGQYFQDRPGFRVLIEYCVIRLIEIQGVEIIDQKLSGLIPFAPLMQPPEGMSPEGGLRQCVQAANDNPPGGPPLSQVEKANFLTDLAILSGLVYNYGTITNIISEETMFESVVAQRLAERGVQQGLRQQSIEDVVEVLEIRWRDPLDPSQVDRLKSNIESIEELQTLKQLHRSAVRAANFDEFKQILDSLA